MKKPIYVLTYPNGEYVGIDTSSGGYPYPTTDTPEFWYNYENVKRCQDCFHKKNFKIWEIEFTLKEAGTTEEIEVYVDAVDFYHEIGEGNAPGPHYIYNTLEEIKKKQPCVEGCGVIKARLVKQKVVLKGSYNSQIEHRLSLSEKYLLMKQCLIDIKNSSECIETHKKNIEDILKKIEND